MKCRCLATAPKRCIQPATPNGICELCNILIDCKANHLRMAIALIWRATWEPGRRWAR